MASHTPLTHTPHTPLMVWVFLSGNDERYVLWKELMPSFMQLLPPPDEVTVGECLVIAASTLADFLGWARNPTYLPVFHEHLHQFVRQCEMVGGGARALLADVSSNCCAR
jgi:hypothetical protein